MRRGSCFVARVRPACGLVQINGEEKLAYDMEYIESRSVGADVMCILKTFKVVFGGKGAR